MAVIKIEDVAYVRFSAPDLERMRVFLTDFGLSQVASSDGALYMRGTGSNPFVHITEEGPQGFVGLALRASSLADLTTLADHEGASVERLSTPGGGHVVRLTDPDGFRVDIVAGQTSSAEIAREARHPWNSAGDRHRNNDVKRLTPGPATVIRLGHVVLAVSNPEATVAWWHDRFGFLMSDQIMTPDGHMAAAFVRTDRGDLPTDHHTMNFAGMPDGSVGFHHAAFEVADFDDLVLGGEHLAAQNHDRIWGVGRHVLGSQVFDYWSDPWGHKVEHWTDGDLLSADAAPQSQGLDVMTGVQWGPALPETFLKVG